MTKLSVIVACYNMQEFLPDTLRALARNVGDDREFILVNDHSRDATGEMLDQAAARIPGVRVIHHETNRGISQVRNTGIDAARGRWLTFLDGDDWYAPGYLTQLLAAVESFDCDFVRTDHVQVTGTSRTLERAPAPRRNTLMDPRDGILPAQRKSMVDYPNVWSMVCRRNVFDDLGVRFVPNLRTCEDRVFTWQLHLRARSYVSTGLHGLFYRRGISTSLTQVGDERQLDFIPAHDLIMEEVLAHPEADRFLPKIVRTYCAMIAFHIGKADRHQSDVARRLRQMSTEALHRMPQELLDRTINEMGPERGRVLRRLLGRTTTRKVTAA
ncbi:glycosyltransferase family 2 protein [Streptomyces millisiae]|uniref:Glycosyltransferase family 2 protein n=1 Tax=Streptomyces millisiae TaxID=3075542 RepID=A0ABU2LS28_9ACTN|nr:glycosyltransferase family 2 protein [Streptomyces sp. DSM 44918]MDT0320395.1 glycosyltransferase family 2 protein [Streptomyces sp. DSM 44918]